MPERTSGVTTAGACIFCEIVARQAPAAIVGENAEALAFLTIGPLTDGHALIIPKRHAVELPDARPEELAAVMELGAEVARRQRSALGSKGENLVLASGRVAEQSIFHLHLHVVPRRENDGVELASWWEARMQRPKPERSVLERIARELTHA
jgi:diadenosine tetraphosphate (Ap4A) HIT family hydrolase